jgi:hypothetical protein
MIVAAFAVAACADTPSPPVIANCTSHGEQASCAGEPSCQWYEPNPPCRSDQPFCSGVCQWPLGVITGDGTASATCTCPTGGTCFEQVGGVARPVYPPSIQCIAELTADACSRIVGQGTCTSSATIGGLCQCDNGIR